MKIKILKAIKPCGKGNVLRSFSKNVRILKDAALVSSRPGDLSFDTTLQQARAGTSTKMRSSRLWLAVNSSA
jgi:hypothetical protein